MIVTAGLGVSSGWMVLRGLGSIPDESTTSGGGPDYSREYYEALRRQRLEREKRSKQVTPNLVTQAQKAYAAVVAIKPDVARQIVQPHALASPVSNLARTALPRLLIDWDRVIADQVAMQSLMRQQMELEDEEALILLIASDY